MRAEERLFPIHRTNQIMLGCLAKLSGCPSRLFARKTCRVRNDADIAPLRFQPAWQFALLASAGSKAVKDFANASFSPDTIAILQSAMEAAVATLPDPVSSSNVQSIAQSILRSAKEGERDPVALQRLALLELQITPRS